MHTDPKRFFEESFYFLTQHPPYPWQTKLFMECLDEHWPELVPLPTGSGKTAVLYIWLLRLAWSIQVGALSAPRRLAWVVNRRVVVDQVTKEAECLVKCGAERCPDVWDLLKRVSVTGTPLAVSTLRGQFADNGAWFRDPSTPAIVIGTVDMIGSRLLFRGYQSGPYHRPIHAGLLGVDTLIVNDENHLSPAFARLLGEIKTYRPASKISGKCFRVLLLSATPGKSELKRFDHSPNEDTAGSEAFRHVFEAPKALTMHEVDSKGIEPKIWQLATDDPLPRTVVFIEKPEKAAAFAKRLEKDGRPVKLMTGTMRGFERDALTKDAVFERFLKPDVPTEPVWLVATSAAEVGVNITCERLITELATADHLLQRFGRLNRFGGDKGEAHVVFAPQREERLLQTLDYLHSLDGDVSCRHVWEHPAPEDAASERPAFARLEPWLIESWAQTTYHDREMPKVQSWLHGKEDPDAPQAELVWRADVKQIIDWDIDPEQIERILQYYPIRPHERLREPANRILKKLEELGDKLGHELSQMRAIRIDSDGSAAIVTLTAVIKSGDVDNCTLVLPNTLGTLENGMFRPEPRADGPSDYDVADREPYGKRRRFLIKENTWTQVPIGEVREDESDKSVLAEYAQEQGFKAPLIISEPDDPEGGRLVYFGELSGKKGVLRRVLLTTHQTAVEERARQLAAATGLNDLAEQFARAGILHDAGKARDVWQNAFGGSKDEPIAKSKAAVNLRLLNGYRHEFGSLINAWDESDLVQHLIASHHAGARPYFTERQFDREARSDLNTKVALDAARRYARLQHQYGAWGLAYLEAIFKAADGTISREEGEPASG